MSPSYRVEKDGARHFGIIIFAKPPELQRSSADEPYAALPWDDLDLLSVAIVEDMIERACQVHAAEIVLLCHAARPSDEFLHTFEGRVRCIELAEKNVPVSYSFLSEYLSSQPYQRLVIIFENYPLLSPQLLMRTFAHLGSEEEKIILGQTYEGHCFYLGIRTPYHSFFPDAAQEILNKPYGMLSHVCKQNAIVCPTQPIIPLNSGYNLALLREIIGGMDEGDPVYPKHTAAVFKLFDKKYRNRKPVQ
jgi:hypothetical protein